MAGLVLILRLRISEPRLSPDAFARPGYSDTGASVKRPGQSKYTGRQEIDRNMLVGLPFDTPLRVLDLVEHYHAAADALMLWRSAVDCSAP